MMDDVIYDLSTPEGLRNAVEWQTVLVNGIRPGGVWMVPRSLSIYVLRHTEKTAYKRCGTPEPSIERVFREMGWTVVKDYEPDAEDA
jgi:hypothetical protein